jgi:hypothetical protein
MKSVFKAGFLLCGALLLGELAFSQVKTNQSLTESKKSIKMDTLRIRSENIENVYFIDKFFVPENSIEEFTQRMKYNRGFIKNLQGFIRDEVYEQKDEEGNLTIITIAVWQSQEDLNNAKSIVQAEYKRINFNPEEFLKHLNIVMERGIYTFFREE